MESINTWNCAALIHVLSRHNHSSLDFDLAAVEVLAVEPGDGALGSCGVVISDGGFALLGAGFSVLVDPDLGLASLLVVLDDADGAEKSGNVFFSQIRWQARGVDLIVRDDFVAAASVASTAAVAASESTPAATASTEAASSAAPKPAAAAS